ncbi:MAG: MOSC domain-containing protein [Verrucomicrobiales bacterium]
MMNDERSTPERQNAASNATTQAGKVVSIHLHPAKGGMEMIPAQEIDLVEGKGILQNKRYFGRTTRAGTPSQRQVSLIEREQIDEHAVALGLMKIEPGKVRSNIECAGIDLVSLVGRNVQVGEAILYFYEPRTPCEKMDAICQGLRDLMENGKQGTLAQVVRSGKVKVGDLICALSPSL